MGCFLGCFGFSSKRKHRRKPPNRLGVVINGGEHSQKLGCYESLNSSLPESLEIKEEEGLTSLDVDFSKKPKELLKDKIRKKVSFNLNVQAYEPIPKEESDEEEKNEEIEEERKLSSTSESNSLEITKWACFPSNHRYRNCIDSYDEDDEIAYEESDLDDEDDEDYYDADEEICNLDDLVIEQESFSEKSENVNPFHDANEAGPVLLEKNQNSRGRNRYAHSVLNPVENTSQWKAIKVREMSKFKQLRKENIPLDQQPEIQPDHISSKQNSNQSKSLVQDIAVTASLSSWVVKHDSGLYGTEAAIKSSTISSETVLSKKSLFERTFSPSSEDMPISDVTNLGY